MAETEGGERLYSRRQVAEMLGKHYSTIRRWEETEKIKVATHVQEGGQREPRFAESEIERLRAELAIMEPTMHVSWRRGREEEPESQEMAALRRENELLREDLARERTLVDRLMKER